MGIAAVAKRAAGVVPNAPGLAAEPSTSILVVDDEAAIRRVLVRWLTAWGYRVREAISATDAIEQIKTEPPTVLFTDLMMPVHDGIWLTVQVRTHWPYIPIVIASAVDDVQTVKTLRAHGAVDYVTKPLGRVMVRQALDRARSKATVSPAAASAALAAVAAPPPAPARKRLELKLVDRRDTPIGVALIVGSVMIFHRPLQFLFDIAADLEGRYHLDLVPALTLFSVVFGFHQYRKHQEARFMGAVASEEARRANERADEMGRLMALGRDLANALTLDALRPLLWEHLPSFGPMRDAWMLVRSAGQWETLLGDSARIDERIAVADSAASETSRQAQAEGIVLGDTVCYPMVVADVPLAVMGLPAAEMTSMTARRRMGAVTALVAIALKNAELYRQTQDKGVRDSLTGCFNRGYTMEAIDNELRRARRTHAPISILIFDVDSFKQINDRHGHLAGDRVLVEVAQQMLRTVRSSDIKCRYGGDEFIVILPETDAAGAARVAENLRQAVSRIAMTAGDAPVKVTISVGVGSADGEDFSVATLLARADDALYEAKRAGRNRVGLPASLT